MASFRLGNGRKAPDRYRDSLMKFGPRAGMKAFLRLESLVFTHFFK